MATPEANQCAGVFRQYRLPCTESPLPLSESTEPYLRYFDCLWADKTDLETGLSLVYENFEDQESVQEAIWETYPELVVEEAVQSRRTEQDLKPQPHLEDLPISDRAYTFEGRRYLYRGGKEPALRWNLAANDPTRNQEYWNEITDQWEEGFGDCPVVPCNERARPGQQNVDDGSDVKRISLGKTKGTFSINYETYALADRISILYQGLQIWSSGCVKTYSGKSHPIAFDGDSGFITVQVQPWCDKEQRQEGKEVKKKIKELKLDPKFYEPKTAWEYTVVCPK